MAVRIYVHRPNKKKASSEYIQFATTSYPLFMSWLLGLFYGQEAEEKHKMACAKAGSAQNWEDEYVNHVFDMAGVDFGSFLLLNLDSGTYARIWCRSLFRKLCGKLEEADKNERWKYDFYILLDALAVAGFMQVEDDKYDEAKALPMSDKENWQVGLSV